jgi:hypothetical protein
MRLNQVLRSLVRMPLFTGVGRAHACHRHRREETVILMSGHWKSRFGGDRSAIGRMVMLESRPREITRSLVYFPIRLSQAVQLRGLRAAEAGRDDQ